LEKVALSDFEGALEELHPEVFDLLNRPAECVGHFLEGHFFREALKVAGFFSRELHAILMCSMKAWAAAF